jgi:hypothetical protein
LAKAREKRKKLEARLVVMEVAIGGGNAVLVVLVVVGRPSPKEEGLKMGLRAAIYRFLYIEA